jgi:hypothetical protein
MTNALQLNQSTVVGGLGTQSFTVTAAQAGLMTLEFKSFLPYLAAGGPAVTTQPSAEATNVTFAADSAGSLNSTYFTFNSGGDLYGYYVWFNINSAGVDPAVSGRTGIQVAGATNASAATLATAAITAINLVTSGIVTASAGASGHVVLTNVQYGDATDAANGTASPGFTYSITQGSFGVPATSGLDVQLKQNSTVLARYGNPSPTQAIMGGSVRVQAVANDVLSVVLSSLSTADNALNAVKTIVNLYQGE